MRTAHLLDTQGFGLNTFCIRLTSFIKFEIKTTAQINQLLAFIGRVHLHLHARDFLADSSTIDWQVYIEILDQCISIFRKLSEFARAERFFVYLRTFFNQVLSFEKWENQSIFEHLRFTLGEPHTCLIVLLSFFEFTTETWKGIYD